MGITITQRNQSFTAMGSIMQRSSASRKGYRPCRSPFIIEADIDFSTTNEINHLQPKREFPFRWLSGQSLLYERSRRWASLNKAARSALLTRPDCYSAVRPRSSIFRNAILAIVAALKSPSMAMLSAIRAISVRLSLVSLPSRQANHVDRDAEGGGLRKVERRRHSTLRLCDKRRGSTVASLCRQAMV
jgi:hypothetical protein